MTVQAAPGELRWRSLHGVNSTAPAAAVVVGFKERVVISEQE